MTTQPKSTYFFKSSIGKKFVMGLTGLFLISFLFIHAFINSMIFFDSFFEGYKQGQLFNEYAHFMGTNIIIRIMEVGLFVGLLVHIFDGLMLWKENNAARPIKYAYSKPNANSTWYSRSMGLLGTLLLVFLIIHLYHFWIPSRFTGLAESSVPGVHDLYAEMFKVFADPAVVVVYVLAQVSLSYHLLHGFKSAFQSLGLNHKKYNHLIATAGVAYAILIPFIFALMPIFIYLRH